ncbi:MAG: sigma-70 family RNA polymerase sigma factor [Nitrospinales bacterium]
MEKVHETQAKKIDTDLWVERYGDQMYRYTLLRVKYPESAEEIVQETFLAAYKSRNSFAGKASEKSWLFGILKHKIMDHFRELKKHQIFDLIQEDDPDPYEDAYDHKGNRKNPPRNWGINPEKAAENKQLLRALGQCVEELPDKFRRLFILKEVDGYSSEYICKELDIQPTNLWVMMHRARNQLKKCLETNWFEKD